MDFRGSVALPGHFGVELDVRKLDDADRTKLAEWIARYKAHRDRLHHGKVWLGEGDDHLLWQAHGDADGLLLFVYRVAPQSHRHAPVVRLPMLDPERRYQIDGTEYDGAWLIQHGLSLPPMKAETGLTIEVKPA